MTSAFEGAMTPEEQKAWLARPPEDGPGGLPTPAYLIRVAVLVIYSALLAALWFGLPRLLWPERYIPKPAFRAAPARAPQQRPAPRPGPPQGPRPPAPRPDAARPGRPAPGPPDRLRPPAAGGGGRGAQPPAPPERPREAWGQRDAGDATVFIPPSKKPGGQA